MSATGDGDPDPRGGPPENVQAALARARGHARAALVEALAALRALLDAASLAASGEPAEAHRALGLVARTLEEVAAGLDEPGRAGSAQLASALAEALEAEIARWEQRAGDDVEARAVLRAFLGVRELLWELGLRASGGGRDPDPARSSRPSRSARPRVQRVRVEG